MSIYAECSTACKRQGMESVYICTHSRWVRETGETNTHSRILSRHSAIKHGLASFIMRGRREIMVNEISDEL